jgi:2-polyprenyl-3-methyl-5-hydroxy-6-metoxy-1,4-benzoquinol methylase
MTTAPTLSTDEADLGTTLTAMPPDPAGVEAFVGRAMADTSAWMVTTMSMIGDRLGLWQALADTRPVTSAELAERTGTVERYVREWLSSMAAHGYLTYDAGTQRFALPAEHVPVLATEGPVFFGGLHQALYGLTGTLGPVVDAIRHGGGVPLSSFNHDWWHGLERFTNAWFDHLLPQVWLPAMPEVHAALRRGADVADVGCGRGRALIRLAQAYPAGRYVGYDIHEESIAAARASAEAAGVADRVHFECRDVSAGIPGDYDVITTFDVIHDAADPRGILRAIRGALRPDGRYVCLDINASHRLEDNAGPLGAYFYGVSVLFCLTTSLAQAGEGLGTCGFNEHTVRELCAEAGFGTVHRVDMDNPFNILYTLVNLNIEDKITFAGLVPQADIPQYLDRAHIMLHTARYETGCAVIQEAMASGVAVCGTDVGLLSDIGDRYAVIVPPGNVEALAVKIVELVNDQKKFESITSAARDWITRHDAAWSAKNYSENLMGVVNGPD